MSLNDTKPTAQKPSATGSTKQSDLKVGSWESRAVLRLIEAGNMVDCPHCQERIKFRARSRDYQAICNIYDDGVWQRVEQYHQECYVDMGEPYGAAKKK